MNETVSPVSEPTAEQQEYLRLLSHPDTHQALIPDLTRLAGVEPGYVPRHYEQTVLAEPTKSFEQRTQAMANLAVELGEEAVRSELIDPSPPDATESAKQESPRQLIDAMQLVEHMTTSTNAAGSDKSRMVAVLHDTLQSMDWDQLSYDQANELLVRVADFDVANKPQTIDPEVAEKQSMMVAVTKVMPGTVLGKLYVTTESATPSVLRTYIDNKDVDGTTSRDMFNLLKRIYSDGLEGNILMLPDGYDSNVDKLRSYIDFTELEIQAIPDGPIDPDDPESRRTFHDALGVQVHDILRNKLGLPEDFVKKMGTAVALRLTATDTEGEMLGYPGGDKYRHSFKRIKRLVESTSNAQLDAVLHEFGAVNLDMYTAKDIKTLHGLLQEDPKTIEHLKAGDVSVVFVDAYGDHNGALTGVFDAYRKVSGRTIMFEVSQPADFYRRMVMLKRLGIKPSTIAVAAHGNPGTTHFGKGEDGFILSANEYLSRIDGLDNIVSLRDARLDRLASDEFMQASRGIDDPAEAAGHRRIIFNSCSSDVAYKRHMPSTIETVVRVMGRNDIEGYGSSDVTYISSDGESVLFRGKKKQKDGSNKFTANASRVKLLTKHSIRNKLRGFVQSLSRGDLIYDPFNLPNEDLPIKRSAIKSIRLRPKAKEGKVA